MALLSKLSKAGAAIALSFALMAPAALADDRGRGDRGGYHDRGDRGHRGDHDRGRRGGWDRGRDHRDWDRGRNHRDRGHDWRDKINQRDWRDRGRHYKPRYSAPRVIHRYRHHTPSYAYPRYSTPRVTYHYNRGYYHGGYRIGSSYTYRPNTIIIRDYSRYGLYAPPHGHHWVRDPYSDDAVLASVATGAIIGLAVGILSQ